jgi:hypothetical protein
MQEMAAGYRGAHRIVLNRNATNLGVGSHINRVVDLAATELIVPSAGDDVSLPVRTSQIVGEWLKTGRKCSAMISAYQEMDEEGRLGEIRSNRPPDGSDLLRRARTWNMIVGCSEAFTKQIFSAFGPLSRDVVSEDAVIFFRAWALGPVVHLAEPLVKYRIHDHAISSQSGASLSPEAMLSKHRRLLAAKAATFKQYLKDLDCPALIRQHDEAALAAARHAVVDELRMAYASWRFASASRRERWRLLGDLISKGAPPRRVVSWVARALFPSLDERNIRRKVRANWRAN